MREVGGQPKLTVHLGAKTLSMPFEERAMPPTMGDSDARAPRLSFAAKGDVTVYDSGCKSIAAVQKLDKALESIRLHYAPSKEEPLVALVIACKPGTPFLAVVDLFMRARTELASPNLAWAIGECALPW